MTGQSRVPSYDFNGNMTNNGTGQTYQWDAENRLVKIIYADFSSREFSYNGLSQRVRVTEKNSANTITSDKRYVWSGGNQPAVTKRFFAEGEQRIGGADAEFYYYAKDHLGSVREVTNSSGAIAARYDFDLWGKRQKLSGAFESEVGYTGHHHHAKSRLVLTWYRAYDAELGRWLSADPIGEEGGLNLYGYVLNDPINGWDPLGLDVFCNQENEAGGHAWVNIGGNTPSGGSSYGAYPNGKLFGKPQFIESPDRHHDDNDFTFERYVTTAADEAALEKWIKKNYDVNDHNSDSNPNYNLGIEDCRSFRNRVRAQLEKIIKARGGKIIKSKGNVK